MLTTVNHPGGTRGRQTEGYPPGMRSVTPPPRQDGGLAVRPSRRGLRFGAYAAVLVAVLAVAAWLSTHPRALDTSERTVRAQTPQAEPVYVGVFDTTADFDRTLHLSGVH